MIENIIFDLDNTLYSSSAEMDRGIASRMIAAVADFFGVGVERAREMRRDALHRFGTTLEWLRSEGMDDADGFFARVHPESEIDELPDDDALRGLLLGIAQKKVVLTNSPLEHAERVLRKLNVADLFCGVVDIRACGLQGKPHSVSYEMALRCCGGTVDDTIFLDDQIKYTDGYLDLGGSAVLVGDENGVPFDKCAIGAGAGSTVGVGNDSGAGSAGAGGKKRGRLFKINSVYFLPELLNKI